MRIAVSIWKDKVSPVLDTASKLLIIESEMKKEVSRFETRLFTQDISQRCHFVRGLNIDVLICGAASRQLSGRLISSGIEVISGISGAVEEVLKAYFQGTLLHPRFLMPGYEFDHIGQSHKPQFLRKALKEKELNKRGGKNDR
jgi:predicted Fe-Mo cluster-binding NifX family protein